MKKGIAVAGNIILDILKPLSGFPVRHKLVTVLEKTYSLGGAVSNVARDLARLDPSLPWRRWAPSALTARAT
jgi:sugar/nucleoside kinase (ribokinase family)